MQGIHSRLVVGTYTESGSSIDWKAMMYDIRVPRDANGLVKAPDNPKSKTAASTKEWTVREKDAKYSPSYLGEVDKAWTPAKIKAEGMSFFVMVSFLSFICFEILWVVLYIWSMVC